MPTDTLQEQVDRSVRNILKSLIFGGMYGASPAFRGMELKEAIRKPYERICSQLWMLNFMPLEDIPLLLAKTDSSYIVHKMAVHRLQTGEQVPKPAPLSTMFPGYFP